MDLFFDVWLMLKNEFWLSRIFKISSEKGIDFRIYSGDDLIVVVKEETLDVEYAYLIAASHLIKWVQRNEGHAKSSTRKESQWVEKLKEQLGTADEVDCSGEGWEMLSLRDFQE